MFASLKAEFRKLLTVRSTYAIVVISLLLVALFAGFGDGYKAIPISLQAPDLLMGESANAIVFVGLVLAFAGLLLLGHEYRYNTIMYTLTSSPSRLRSLTAKIVAASVFAVITALLVSFFSPLCTIVGAHLHGYHIAPQHYDYWSVVWHSAFVGWGYAMYAFILIALLRNQVGAIVTFLLIPLIGESILGHIFRNTSKYYPFTSLQSVVMQHSDKGSTTVFSPDRSALVALAYIVAGLAISVALFLKRDATSN